MSNELKPQPAPALLTVPLTMILSGSGLEHLNAYRKAVHALPLKNWPDDAKEGNAPDKYREYYEKQSAVAADALARILSDAADETTICAAE